jgi:tRNA(fMet)-specific endonuclease VapC
VIVLDTDICIEILRGNKVVLRKRAAYPDDVAVSFMTAAELYFGAENSGFPAENHALVQRFLVTMPVLEAGDGVLRRFGGIKAMLKRKRQLIPDADIFIGATALEHAEALATGNAKHFSRIDGLVLEDWAR